MALSLSCIRLLSGATVSNPVGSSAEENVMCHANDRYKGEDITVHEFAHSMHLLGLTFVYESFEQELQTLYQKAKYLKEYLINFSYVTQSWELLGQFSLRYDQPQRIFR